MIHHGFDDYFTEEDFFEIPHLNFYLDRKRVERLKKSKVVSLWLKFFKDWFKISLEIKDIHIIDIDKNPGDPMVIVPKEINLSMCLEVVRERLEIFDDGINKINESKVSFFKLRRKKGTYLTYNTVPSRNSTVIESLLLNLFSSYKDISYDKRNIRYVLKYLEIKSSI